MLASTTLFSKRAFGDDDSFTYGKEAKKFFSETSLCRSSAGGRKAQLGRVSFTCLEAALKRKAKEVKGGNSGGETFHECRRVLSQGENK